MPTTADEVKYNLSRNGNGQNNVITESEIEVMLFLPLLLFSLLLVWKDTHNGSGESEQNVRKKIKINKLINLPSNNYHGQ